MSGTYQDKNHLLPRDNDTEFIKDAIERKKYRNKGGKQSCGHDFWERAKEMEFGEVVFCRRCSQFFAKIKVLPWLTQHTYHKDYDPAFGENHIDGVWYAPVEPRVTIDAYSI